jgi:hypothetical protein
MKGLLIRVGIDQAFGAWNAPVDPETGEFVYVPIPDGAQREGLETSYSQLKPALAHFPGSRLPPPLAARATHLDPDFERLTYGDNGLRRGRGLADFGAGDVVAFFAGLRPIRPWRDPLVYALIGVFRVRECVQLRTVPQKRWFENAHTRRVEHRPDDIIVRADPALSGRLRRCIPIGEWRNRAYRVRQDILDAWGDLSCRDGFIQRSAVPPRFRDATRFLSWFENQKPDLVTLNNP